MYTEKERRHELLGSDLLSCSNEQVYHLSLVSGIYEYRGHQVSSEGAMLSDTHSLGWSGCRRTSIGQSKFLILRWGHQEARVVASVFYLQYNLMTCEVFPGLIPSLPTLLFCLKSCGWESRNGKAPSLSFPLWVRPSPPYTIL